MLPSEFYITISFDGVNVGSTPCYFDGVDIKLCDGSYGLLDALHELSDDEDACGDTCGEIETLIINRLYKGKESGSFRFEDHTVIYSISETV